MSAPLPGGIGVTHLRVYTSEAPDGLCGGTPHMHVVCSEAYSVLAGRGRVQTLGPDGFKVTSLEPGKLVWYPPGTIHRLVNDDGALELLVMMQNAGLPEAGDMVICFPDEHLVSPETYSKVAALPPDEVTTSGSGQAARRRRDLGVEGFGRLVEDFEREGLPALARFYDRASQLLSSRATAFETLFRQGAEADTRASRERLTALAAGDSKPLFEAELRDLDVPVGERRMGCCGTLAPYATS
jgi:mannose-6-phosphate isomerase-like protein (cupin superfamily)